MDEKPLAVDQPKTGTRRRGAKRRKGKPVKLPATKDAKRRIESGIRSDDVAIAGRVVKVDRPPDQKFLINTPIDQQIVGDDVPLILKAKSEDMSHSFNPTYSAMEVLSKNKPCAALDSGAAKPFVCKLCGKSYSNKGSYQRHLRVSRCGAEQSYSCTHCSFTTSRKSTWLQHLAEIHRVDPEGNELQLDVKCPNCDFVCVTKPRLTSHVRRKHTTDKPHKCTECVYSSITKCDLEKHVRIVHRNERPYMCETCGFCSKTVSGFNSHMRSHAGIRPFRCELCDKAFSRGARLRIHMQKHADAVKPYVCNLCGYACRRRDNLLVHMRRVHKEDAARTMQ